jgi:predicted flap endonuclease-1-like 5' DNA nuclease
MGMSALAAFILGVLAGLAAYWLVYWLSWRRWRGYLEKDLAYFKAKVESVQYTNFGLERQLTAQKADLAGLRSKIADLERENWQAQVRLEAAKAEKEALITHLETLRFELASYKKAAAEADMPALSPVKPSNGKTHEPAREDHSPERVSIPLSSPLENKQAALKKIPTNGRAKTLLPPDPITEPVLVIARPRMDGDRLEIIQGIGPAIFKRLRLAGVDSFQALALLTADRLREIAGPRAAKLMDAESVIEQAKRWARKR